MIVCVKIVAECNEYVLLETAAIQDTQDGVFSSFDTSIAMKLNQKREIDIRSGLICAKRKSGSRQRFLRSRSGFAATVKTYSFSWPVYSSLSLVESLTFSWYSGYCMQHEFGISC